MAQANEPIMTPDIWPQTISIQCLHNRVLLAFGFEGRGLHLGLLVRPYGVKLMPPSMKADFY
ncbi:hypothetical protein [Xenorhabdus bovienii]|uniref:Uncharacterized protein n=1 Tax=Xenorhabdus bovienii TaxID=40576 RepID=A0AAJ1N1Q3_XENBV|nr:hypothetical protein [Xenorhabdus bovienii]MDE1474231.1 hypothetical protein [Xenorhabdus bovienii]MDE1477371.1 hypothetical protein [Xenorhabdus bovienii]MDE1480923.1 hypothetical protein [Xenorhabdus bovienii]MDE1485592.1 hypothetical protein [Xenorhabdus bovienii]MDE1489564.1 hypothetical protein [Xenorhabdus bovienii]